MASVYGFCLKRTSNLLCDHGCDVYATDREGDDALWIAEYCCYDVKITKMVHEFGAKNGCVFYNNRFGKVLNVDVDWSTA